MPLRSDILKRLGTSPNLSVESAVEVALLANPAPPDQKDLVEVLIGRNRRAGWVTLIKAYHRLTDEARATILNRRREIFGPLSEAMQDIEGATRANIIDIVRRSHDPHLTYLLAQALIDSRQEIRELAGQSFLTAVLAAHRAFAEAGQTDLPFDPEAAAEIRRALDYGLRQFKTHKQAIALVAALVFERQQDAPMWAHFNDPHDDAAKTAAAILRNPPPVVAEHFAAATLLALGSPLKPAAVAGFSSTENISAGIALTRESFRLIDPVLREVAQGIGHLKCLPVLWKEAPPTSQTWHYWLRLVEAVGLQPVEKATWLARLLEKSLASEGITIPWKLSVMQAIANTHFPEAGKLIARMLNDADERVARSAARYLLSRKNAEWRNLAAASFSPHHSVRRMIGIINPAGRPGVSAMTERVTAVVGSAGGSGAPDPAFGRVWNEYPGLPPAVQHSTSRAAAVTDPLFFEQMKVKLCSQVTLEVAQGLKMISVLPSLAAYRAQIIALCGHLDARIAGIAVRLVGRLEDPRLKDLLEAAAQHSDPRVRANAVESMSSLHIANRSQQVLGMLNSRHNRERANAIKAISEFDFNTAKECLQRMLADPNPLHRISALWVVQQLAFPDIFRQVSVIARKDPNVRVRKRAADMLESLTGNVPAETPRR